MMTSRSVALDLGPLGPPIASRKAQLGERTALDILRFRHRESEVCFADPTLVSVVVSLSSGQLVERLQEGERKEKGATTGTLSVIDPLVASRFTIRGSADVLILRAPLQAIRAASPAKDLAVRSVFNEQRPAIEAIAYGVLEALHDGEAPDDLLASSVIERLAASIAAAPGTAPIKGGLGLARMRKVRELMHGHAAGPSPTSPRLADLAGELGLSVHHFAREFHRSFGRTPHAYMVRLRLERARSLVAETDQPIAQIGRATGFWSHSHFTWRFHQEFGVTPSVLRRAVRL